MNDHTANVEAVRRVKDYLPSARIAAIASHPDDVRELEVAGVDVARNLYDEAGQGLADDAVRSALPQRSALYMSDRFGRIPGRGRGSTRFGFGNSLTALAFHARRKFTGTDAWSADLTTGPGHWFTLRSPRTQEYVPSISEPQWSFLDGQGSSRRNGECLSQRRYGDSWHGR